ncbi:hypothetical protein LN042_34355 [Kitasatospora sp. RB6PN24]|uniref:hypothetical protein n=1 Tax=Kitasatospora humi TaxID=2893891 RepID=UPI001E412E4C|nr:hypothetical protein [Kitasatospora humi]MCC9312084.1 hypothetical protein [Kitasatospora humi]
MKQNTSTTGSTVKARREQAAYRRYVARQLGPQQVGGIYRCGYWNDVYEVLAIRTESPWHIQVRTLGETRIRTHCTAWDYQQDQVVAEPGEAATTAWAAHAHTHPATSGALAEQRHLLDEIAHPVSTAAFQQLAHTAQIGA